MRTVEGRWVLGGGIASGKSRVRDLLEGLGVPTIDGDEVGHSVLEVGGGAYGEVADRWPQVVVDGVIDRGLLAQIVFRDRTQLGELESMTHPHIFDRIVARVERFESGVVVELPLIGHGLGDGWRQIVVDCRDESRVDRALARGMDEADVRARIDAQPSRARWLAAADAVIPNHGSLEDLERTVEALVPHL